MDKNTRSSNLKVFFIKLISISIAIIIIINVLFNLIISDKFKHFDSLFALTELEERRVQADILRDNLNDLLKKDSILKKEDKILLYKLYQKLKLEFEQVN